MSDKDPTGKSEQHREVVGQLSRALGLGYDELIEAVAMKVDEHMQKPLRETHQGALNEVAAEGKMGKETPNRRDFLTTTVLGLLSIAIGIAELGAGRLDRQHSNLREAAEDTKEEKREGESLQNERYKLSGGYLRALEEGNYYQPGLIAHSAVKSADFVIQASLDAYKNSSVPDMVRVGVALKDLAENSVDPNARSLACWRLMVDNCYLSKGAEANKWLQQIAIQDMPLDLQLKVLDGKTSTALNLMSWEDFLTLQSDSYAAATNSWDEIDLDLSSPAAIAGDFREGRIGAMTGAVQHMSIKAVQAALNAGAGLEDAQAKWFEDLWELNHHLSKKPSALESASDFLQSLTRVTFHAHATGNDSLTSSLLDFYFDRKRRRNEPPTIAEARRNISQSWPGNSAWMKLLEMKIQGKVWARKELNKLIEDGDVNFRPGSRHVGKALYKVGSDLSIDHQKMVRKFGLGIVSSPYLLETLLVPYYLDQVDVSTV